MNARIFIDAGDIESSGMFGARQRLSENLVLRQ
jgi:hypothetical protein